MKKTFASLCLSFLLCTCSFAAQQPRTGPAEPPPPPHNGLWWHKKSSTYREGFIVGYKSAMHRANGHAVEIDQYPASELLDGVDKFYDDFKNQNILVDDTLHYVVDQVRGVSDDALKAELLKMRAAAAPTGVD